MARPLRIEYPDAWYHVMNRGAGHKTIFKTEVDYQLFLDILKEAHERYQLAIHAYCLMDNHYHLFVKTPLSNLNKIMRHVNGVFTQKSNRINQTDGALFRGRYKAILVDTDEYAMQLSRYIHLNPVSAGIVKKPEDYRWSSYSAYLNLRQRPEWLSCEHTLNFFKSNDQVLDYAQFVSEGDEGKKAFLINKKFPILAKKSFIKTIKDEHINLLDKKEIPEKLNIVNYFSPTLENIINTVSEHYKVLPDTLVFIKNKKSLNLPRKIAIFLAFRRFNKARKVITKKFQGLSYQSISALCSKIDAELKRNERLQQDVRSLTYRLVNMEKSIL